jgi:hypothetical protein
MRALVGFEDPMVWTCFIGSTVGAHASQLTDDNGDRTAVFDIDLIALLCDLRSADSEVMARWKV